jgi:hypothetical protein
MKKFDNEDDLGNLENCFADDVANPPNPYFQNQYK